VKQLPTDLSDYSGEYIPELEFENLSKDTLVKLLGEFARLLVCIAGIYDTVVTREVGPEKALELVEEVWQRQYDVQIPRVAKILNIKGDDVLTMFKVMQFTPDGYATGGQWKAKLNIIDKNDVIFTLTHCRTLEYFERHGQDFQIRGICGPDGQEWVALKKYAQFANPDIKVIALKNPPRSSPNEIACQWEFKLEPKHGECR